jgi:TRAP-type uncharacterized transport system fused permease subunit
VLFSGYTPYMAAFLGIMLCVIVGFTSTKNPITLIVPIASVGFVLMKTIQGTFSYTLCALLLVCITIGVFNRRERQDFSNLWKSMHLAVQYALAVGAASAAVGIVVGVINTTGVGFRLGFMVTTGAAQMAEFIAPVFAWIPGETFSVPSIQLFISLIFVAIACILMGAGLPTTALYIMLASVAQPALAQLGIPALASHMFVLYYGVISEITPPVCASAYAAAAIGGANPFRTGVSAFTLGLGKLVVPMVFVYAPTMLIMLPEYFTWSSFFQVSISCAFGIVAVASAITGYLLIPIGKLLRFVMTVAGVMWIAPGLPSDVAALLIVLPIIISQLVILRKARDNEVSQPA